MVSVRIIKSVFLRYSPDLSELFIQVGLCACALIGPFLFLYVYTSFNKQKPKYWILHIIIPLTVMVVLSILYPYREFRPLWAPYLIRGIYAVWFVYIIASGLKLKPFIRTLFSKKEKLANHQIWMLSVYFGVFFIWAGYNIGAYTSYLVGALSFSVVFYLIILLWVLNRRKNSFFFEPEEKYSNKKITGDEADILKNKLHMLLTEEELYKNPNLKLSEVAKNVNINSHYLSQFLNDNLQKSFSLFINEYRIEAAKKLLVSNANYTTEAIGYECGFNSKSTFFSTFKKLAGCTPANYKNQYAV